MAKRKLLSIVIPVFNEADNIVPVYQAVREVFAKLPYAFEIMFVDDGSSDGSSGVLSELRRQHNEVRSLHLARNFGKEIALTAGLQYIVGDAAIMLDADLQHPPKYIPKFIKKWDDGADVVVGVRKTHAKKNPFKEFCSALFYKLLNKMSHVYVKPHATDYRLLDRQVIDAYNRFTERNRIMRGLVDWLGFHREYVYFDAETRLNGVATYDLRKLFKLARDSFVSMSLMPLRISMYLGIVIVCLSGPVGVLMFVDTYFMNKKLGFSGPAMLGTMILFLVGILLINLGLVAYYIANIHDEVVNRPLYVLRREPAYELETETDLRSLPDEDPVA